MSAASKSNVSACCHPIFKIIVSNWTLGHVLQSKVCFLETWIICFPGNKTTISHWIVVYTIPQLATSLPKTLPKFSLKVSLGTGGYGNWYIDPMTPPVAARFEINSPFYSVSTYAEIVCALLYHSLVVYREFIETIEGVPCPECNSVGIHSCVA